MSNKGWNMHGRREGTRQDDTGDRDAKVETEDSNNDLGNTVEIPDSRLDGRMDIRRLFPMVTSLPAKWARKAQDPCPC